jgi:hypothetical protein
MKSLRNNIIELSHIKWGFDSLIKTRDDLVPQKFYKLSLGSL